MSLHRIHRAFAVIAIALSGLIASTASAQITDAWKHKVRWILDTTDAGAGLKSAQAQFVVPIRLHTGNFDFSKARPDGGDLRVVAPDGKAILPHRIEYYDAANELAVLWVRVPTLAPGNAEPSIWLYSGNPAAEAANDPVVRDGVSTVILHAMKSSANERADGIEIDLSAAQPQAQGLLGEAIRLDASGRIQASGSAMTLGGDGTTVSMWVRPDASATGSLIQLKGAQSTIEVSLNGGVPAIKAAGAGVAAGAAAKGSSPLPGGEWRHLTLVLGERAALFVDGTEVAGLPAKLPAQAAQLIIGGGAAFDVDALSVSKVVRSSDWIRATGAAQGPDNKMVALAAEDGEGGEADHFKILVENLTLDGKIAIYVLAAMLLAALWTMISKALQLARVSKANQQFLTAFREAGPDAFLEPGFGKGSAGASAVKSRFEASPLYRMYETAGVELRKRLDTQAAKAPAAASGTPAAAIGPKATNAIRAAIDATLVREGARLNRLMVLLTIAISGGPFIGLLGTVVGVMITFAAIAAIGDVNINAIAPGIAAALLATVAGLAVAIPALFAYNWFASRIKDLTNEMAIFSDELTSRISERYEA
jgi:biopolymer transport protein ExbB